MDNNKTSLTPKGQPVQGMQAGMGPNGRPMVQSDSAPVYKKDNSSLMKTIAIIVLALVSVTFIGLFVWILIQFNDINGDRQSAIDEAVAEAKYEQREEDSARFTEEEKYPLRAFVGPADYGELSFKYPKTWSVYVAKDAVNGGDYEAYFNPLQVEPVSDTNINALRLAILDKDFEAVASEYQKVMDREKSDLQVETVEVNGITMNRYTGTIPKTELSGVIVIFKIRDKTAVFRTDASAFIEDFDALLETVQFNA